MANWFEYLNKEKSILKKHYDLKLPTANSGDSGVGEFLCTSGTSSFSSSLSSSQNIQNNANLLNSSSLLASLSVTSLANVSIFENEEYFNYYHKLLQQFTLIEFSITSFNVNHEKYVLNSGCDTLSLLSPPPSTLSERNHEKKVKPAVPLRKPNMPTLTQTNNRLATLPNSLSSPLPTHLSTSNGTNSGNGVLKSISKRFNIKSWFSNSNDSPNLKRKEFLSSQSTASQVSTNSGNASNNMGQTTPPQQSNKLSLYETPPTKCCQNITQLAKQHQLKVNKNGRHHNLNNLNNTNASLMKHSLSEPSLNALIN